MKLLENVHAYQVWVDDLQKLKQFWNKENHIAMQIEVELLKCNDNNSLSLEHILRKQIENETKTSTHNANVEIILLPIIAQEKSKFKWNAHFKAENMWPNYVLDYARIENI